MTGRCRHTLRGSALLLIAASLMTPTIGAGQDDAKAPAAYLAGTESRLVTAAVTGRTYQVSIAMPRGYANSGQRYPVAYVLDANLMFGTVVESARIQLFDETVPELIVVGVGYPVGYYVNAIGARMLDLTPTPDPSFEAAFARELTQHPAPEGSGGGPAFLEFLRSELVPLIDREYRTDPADRALIGHSFGGLFAFHALLAGDDTFRRFIVGSPSLWWDRRTSFAHEAAFARDHRALPVRAFFALGGLEGDESFLSFPYRMRSNFDEMIGLLRARNYEGFELAATVFDGDTHHTVVAPLIGRGLAFVYAEEPVL